MIPSCCVTPLLPADPWSGTNAFSISAICSNLMKRYQSLCLSTTTRGCDFLTGPVLFHYYRSGDVVSWKQCFPSIFIRLCSPPEQRIIGVGLPGSDLLWHSELRRISLSWNTTGECSPIPADTIVVPHLQRLVLSDHVWPVNDR